MERHTWAWKPKVRGSSPLSGWKYYRGVKEIAFPFPCSPVKRECS